MDQVSFHRQKLKTMQLFDNYTGIRVHTAIVITTFPKYSLGVLEIGAIPKLHTSN